MNERDPISEWENAIGKRICTATVVVFLFAFVCCMVAPLFGPWIKQTRRMYYAMYSDYEERASKDMMVIYPILWIIAILGWAFAFWCNFHYPR